MSKELWDVADEEVREEMCNELGCEDEELDQEEVERRVEARYQSKIGELYDRAKDMRG